MEADNRNRRVVLFALAGEGSLGLIGWALCDWLGIPLASRLAVTGDAVLRSVVAAAPMLALLVFLTRAIWKPLADLRRQVEVVVGELFGKASWRGIAAVAIAAGAGEELLFRGALQPLFERWWGPAAGLAAASLLFGLVHAVSAAYFVFATIVGLYLGWLAWWFDDLVAPIAVHAIYDWAALATVLRWNSRSSTHVLE